MLHLPIANKCQCKLASFASHATAHVLLEYNVENSEYKIEEMLIKIQHSTIRTVISHIADIRAHSVTG